MRTEISAFLLTMTALLGLDAAAFGVLAVAERVPPMRSLVGFFEYGRSVPGKLEGWLKSDEPNLFEAGWSDDILAKSGIGFEAEEPAAGPVVRTYGMSFVDHITDAAKALDPTLRVDAHAGPGAPPNFTYSLFKDDRPNRRRGDVVVLGVLSSSVAALAALSNSTWAFEQPAPFTYPIFLPLGADGLSRIDPVVDSAAEAREALRGGALAEAWRDQLAAQDAFYGAAAFAVPELDVSPFARLVRRSLATAAIEKREAAVIAGEGDAPYPYAEVLRRMIVDFVRTARADGQWPVVALIQGRGPRDPNLLKIARSVLESEGAPYLATAKIQDPRDSRGYLPDSHFTPDVNQRLGCAFLRLLPASASPEAVVCSPAGPEAAPHEGARTSRR